MFMKSLNSWTIWTMALGASLIAFAGGFGIISLMAKSHGHGQDPHSNPHGSESPHDGEETHGQHTEEHKASTDSPSPTHGNEHSGGHEAPQAPASHGNEHSEGHGSQPEQHGDPEHRAPEKKKIIRN